MAMKRLLSLLAIVGLLTTVNQSLSAQNESVVDKQIYVEWGGPGVVLSANFDARFKLNSRLGLGYKLGVGYGTEKFDDSWVRFLKMVDILYFLKESEFERPFYTFPMGLNYAFGNPNKASSFEVGGGVTLLTRRVSLYYYEMKKPGYMIGFLSFMYRIMPVQGNFSFRAGFTPIIGTSGDLFPMGAIGIGYTF